MQKTLGFYNDILTSMRYSVDNEGLISNNTATGVPSPAVVEGKRLVMPTKKWLKTGFGDEFVGFHPLAESNSRLGTSPVLQHMQRNARAQISFTYVYLAQQLLRVATDAKLHKELPPTCNEFLKKMQAADANLIKVFDKLINAATQKNRLITVYLKNGGTYNGKKVNRLAVIRFPLLELLETDEPKVLGVEVKPKQRQTILTLLRTILPAGDDPEEYSAGSNNRVAPYLHAFLQAYLKVITQLNKIIARYGKPLDLPVKPFPVFEEETLKAFGEFYDEIPPLEGNFGGVDETEEEAQVAPVKVEVAKPIVGVAPVTVQATVAQPARVSAAQVVKDDDNTIDFDSLKRSMMPAQAVMAQPQGYPNPMAMGMGGGPVVLPWQQQPQVAQAPHNPYAQVAATTQMQQHMPLHNPYGTGQAMQMQPQYIGGQAVGHMANNLV